MRKILLSRGGIALVDDSDFEYLNQFKWNTMFGKYTCYAFRMYSLNGDRKIRKSILMHREILGTPKGMETDHIDGNGLNNQRSNIRISTVSENRGNQVRNRLNKTSKFKGVSWSISAKKWVANIQVNKRYMHLGSFSDEKDAAMVYDYFAIDKFREFASTNFKY